MSEKTVVTHPFNGKRFHHSADEVAKQFGMLERFVKENSQNLDLSSAPGDFGEINTILRELADNLMEKACILR
jgi:hypothetical protein